jgi:hypothetical protein
MNVSMMGNGWYKKVRLGGMPPFGLSVEDFVVSFKFFLLMIAHISILLLC